MPVTVIHALGQSFISCPNTSVKVNAPTRGSNILDIFLTNRPSLIEACEIVDGISDHEAVMVKSHIMVKLLREHSMHGLKLILT